jgi:hypothetical protein
MRLIEEEIQDFITGMDGYTEEECEAIVKFLETAKSNGFTYID